MKSSFNGWQRGCRSAPVWAPSFEADEISICATRCTIFLRHTGVPSVLFVIAVKAGMWRLDVFDGGSKLPSSSSAKDGSKNVQSPGPVCGERVADGRVRGQRPTKAQPLGGLRSLTTIW